MSTPQYLVHGKTGRVFNYSANLAKRADMEPAAGIDEANAMAMRLGGAPAFVASAPVVAESTPSQDDGSIAELYAVFDALNARVSALEQTQGVVGQAAVDASSGDETLVNDGNPVDGADPDESVDGDFVISTATKDQLEQFAKAEYGTDLDKRKSVDTLRAEVAELAQAGDGA